MQMAALLEANRTPCDEHPAAGQALRAGQLYDRGGSQLRRGEPLRAGSRRHLSYGGGLIDCNLPVIHRESRHAARFLAGIPCCKLPGNAMDTAPTFISISIYVQLNCAIFQTCQTIFQTSLGYCLCV
jgi:hypothetical protein